jgi:hypothetical protein
MHRFLNMSSLGRQGIIYTVNGTVISHNYWFNKDKWLSVIDFSKKMATVDNLLRTTRRFKSVGRFKKVVASYMTQANNNT